MHRFLTVVGSTGVNKVQQIAETTDTEDPYQAALQHETDWVQEKQEDTAESAPAVGTESESLL